MIKIYKKNIANKDYFYLTEQINIGKKYKKIQVYIGKNIPNDLARFYSKLEKKEIVLMLDNINEKYSLNNKIQTHIYEKIEKTRIKFKYYFAQTSESKQEILWRNFAIKFIFESNSMEGSKLSKKEVESIVNNQYIKKSLDKKEVIEVENSIKAFNMIRDKKFSLNQNNVKQLHKTIVNGLNIDFGYKKKQIIVNNKNTVDPKKVRENMTSLFSWWQKESKTSITTNFDRNPFILAVKFHQSFELIHPFSDGNGRVGRIILVWMLIKNNYGPLLIKNQNRRKYFSALDKADKNKPEKLYKYCADSYEKTFSDLIMNRI